LFAIVLAGSVAVDAAAQERARLTIVYLAEMPEIDPGAEANLPNAATVIARERARNPLTFAATVIARERARNPLTIVAHGGNALSPSFVSALDEGAHMVRLLNRMTIDVAAPNAHDYDFGPDVAARNFAAMEFPMLAVNVTDPSGAATGLKPSVMLDAGSFRIDFVGVVGQDANVVSSSGRLAISPVVATARAEIARLRRDGADYVVLLDGSRGAVFDDATEIGADMILASAGRGPARWSYDGRQAMAWVGNEGATLAVADIDLRRKAADIGAVVAPADASAGVDVAPERIANVVVARPALRLIDTRAVEPDPLMEIVTQIELRQAEAQLSETVAAFRRDFAQDGTTALRGEARLGSLIADFMRSRTRADVALIDGGMLHRDRGFEADAPFRLRDVAEILPVPARLTVLALRGADLRAALEHGLSRLPQLDARFPQVSGLTLRYDPRRPAGRRILSVSIGRNRLEADRLYRVATTDFLARGGDGYVALTRGTPEAIDAIALRDLLVSSLKELKEIEVPDAGRLVAVAPR
jgi:2',3'-cyclic-nucleotide 2'-phosphodiesterase (5'-nucleotidase family)